MQSTGSKLFVGNLSWSTDNSALMELFSQFGEVLDAAVMQDHDTGRSRGFGFVTFKEVHEAEAAMKSLNGQSIDDREIRVNYATGPAGGGGGGQRHGGGGGGGGYRGGGRGRGGYNNQSSYPSGRGGGWGGDNGGQGGGYGNYDNQQGQRAYGGGGGGGGYDGGNPQGNWRGQQDNYNSSAGAGW